MLIKLDFNFQKNQKFLTYIGFSFNVNLLPLNGQWIDLKLIFIEQNEEFFSASRSLTQALNSFTGGKYPIRNHRLLLIITGTFAVLLTISFTFSIFYDQDFYDYHSGVGQRISVSPNDLWLLFSYYENGNEAIYRGSIEDGTVEKVAEQADSNLRKPQYAPDGDGFLYLAAANDRVQSLYYKRTIGTEQRRLTDSNLHIADAAFSPDGNVIYFIAIPSEDYLKPEGEKENGADLFSLAINGGELVKLTDKDSFAMDRLTVSADGKTLYYSEFDGVQRLMAYSLEEGADTAFTQNYLSGDVYQPVLSPNEELLAFTAVSDESRQQGSTFEYELFLMDSSTGETDRLTDFTASVTSPVFFHHENRLAFLMQPNWPSEPAIFQTMTVDASNGEITPLELKLPEQKNAFQASVLVYWFTNPLIMTSLYLLLFSSWTIYSRLAWNKVFLPTKISAVVAGIVIAGSFISAAFDPWMGIGLFMLAAGLAACTVVLFVFALIYSKFEPQRSISK